MSEHLGVSYCSAEPSAAYDPWQATDEQRQAAERRLYKACPPGRLRTTVRVNDLRQMLHDKGLAELGAEICGEVRRAAKEVTGGNFSFAIDDIAVIEHLAIRAVEAGLIDGLHPAVAKKALAAAEARRQADGTEAATPASQSPGKTS